MGWPPDVTRRQRIKDLFAVIDRWASEQRAEQEVTRWRA